MSRSTLRVLATLELLQSRGRVSGPELAAHLGVDPRTVRRYIAALEDLGIPVTAEQGSAGGYEVVAGFKLPPPLRRRLARHARGLLGIAERAPTTRSSLHDACTGAERPRPRSASGRMK